MNDDTGSSGTSRTGRLCALQDAVGRVEACPGARCPFWEPGGAVLAGGCLIERLALDLERRPDLSHDLLRLRIALDEGRADLPGTRQLFYRLSHEPGPAAWPEQRGNISAPPPR